MGSHHHQVAILVADVKLDCSKFMRNFSNSTKIVKLFIQEQCCHLGLMAPYSFNLSHKFCFRWRRKFRIEINLSRDRFFFGQERRKTANFGNWNRNKMTQIYFFDSASKEAFTVAVSHKINRCETTECVWEWVNVVVRVRVFERERVCVSLYHTARGKGWVCMLSCERSSVCVSVSDSGSRCWCVCSRKRERDRQREVQ